MTQPQDALVPTTQSAVAVTVTVAKPIGMTPKSNVLLDGTRTWTGTAAVLRVAHALGWPWRLAWVAWLIPCPLRDALYRRIARNRYRWFGRREICFVPDTDDAERFIR